MKQLIIGFLLLGLTSCGAANTPSDIAAQSSCRIMKKLADQRALTNLTSVQQQALRQQIYNEEFSAIAQAPGATPGDDALTSLPICQYTPN